MRDINEIVEIYTRLFESDFMMAEPKPLLNLKERKNFSLQELNHCYYMLKRLPEFFETNENLDKGHRWLGFIQGVLWARGIFSIHDLKNHNRENEGNNNGK